MSAATRPSLPADGSLGVMHDRPGGGECPYLAIGWCGKCGWADYLYRPGTVARFTVDGEPVSKGRPRHGNGTTYTPAATKRAEEAVGWKFREAARSHKADADHEYGVVARFHLGTGKRRDVDNLLKLVLDGLNKVAWADDHQVTDVSARKVRSPGAGRSEIVVYRITEAAGGDR